MQISIGSTGLVLLACVGCGGAPEGGDGQATDTPATTGSGTEPVGGSTGGDTTGAASSSDDGSGGPDSSGSGASSGSSSGGVEESGTEDGTSSESGETGEAACELDPVGPASGAVQTAWSVGPHAEPADIASDALGNIVIAGELFDADFGSGPVSSADGPLFVAKYDTAGALAWVATLDAAIYLVSVAVDANGDVFVTGGFDDGVLAKLDGSDGAELWVADTGQYSADDVAILPGGDAVVHYAPNPPYSQVHRISGIDGQVVWSRYVVEPVAFGDYAGGEGLSVAGDTILWGGYARGTIPTPAGDVVPDPEVFNIAVVAMDGAGDTLWAYLAESPTGVFLADVAADPCGGVYVYAEVQGYLDVGLDDELLGSNDLVVIRLDAQGAPQWAKSYPSVDYVFPEKIATDAQGSVLLTGRLSDVDFGLGSTSWPTDAGFLAKLDRDGQTQWVHLFEGMYWNESRGAAFDDQGRPWVVGIQTSDIDIAGTAVPNPGDSLATYVARFEP